MKNNYLVQGWLVITLALCFGAALAGVQISLSERIEENQKNKTLSRVPQVVPGAFQDHTEPIQIDGQTVYKAFDVDHHHVGWVVRASGQGYADVIDLLVGLDPEAQQITGISVLSQKETPGLGDAITTPEFQQRFAGLPTSADVAVDKDGGQIQAITSATVSSRSVCQIVNQAVDQWKDKLAAR
jgi:electron transport complex protein RnfG